MLRSYCSTNEVRSSAEKLIREGFALLAFTPAGFLCFFLFTAEKKEDKINIHNPLPHFRYKIAKASFTLRRGMPRLYNETISLSGLIRFGVVNWVFVFWQAGAYQPGISIRFRG